MKKTLLFTSLLLFAMLAGLAQNLTLYVNAHPSPYLADWEGRQETIRLVINHTGNDFEAKIKAQVFRNGTLVAASSLAAIPAMTIESGVTVLGPEDLVPYHYVTYYGKTQQQGVRTGRLPAGDYQLCLSLVDPITLNEITQPTCQSFYIPDYQPPTCLFPINQSELAANSLPGTTLRWPPVMPLPSDLNIQYDVCIYEVLAGQYAEQAIRSNRPIVAVSVENQTFLPWPTDYELPEEGRYVWTVKAMDMTAEPARFRVQIPQLTIISSAGSRISAKVPCRFNDYVFLFDCETCELLKGECSDNMVPDADYEEKPAGGISVRWGNIPSEVQQGRSLQAQIKTSSNPLVMDFVVRSLTTNEVQQITNTADDFYWNTGDAKPGMYELQARVANRHNASDISSVYVNIAAATHGNIACSFDFRGLTDREVLDSLRRVNDHISRLPGQIKRDDREADNASRAVTTKEGEQVKDRRRWNKLAGSSYRLLKIYHKLYEIDKRFNQVPVAITPKVDSLIQLLDSLKNLGVAPQPNMVALRQAVATAKANLKACRDARDAAQKALNNLKTAKIQKQAALKQAANQVHQIMQAHGWASGVHYYKDGTVGFGGVGDANSTLQRGHPDYNTYNNAFNKGRQLNREIRSLNRKIAAAKASFKNMDDCKDEAKALIKAQNALKNGNMSQSLQNQLDDLCEQLKDLMKPLKKYCENNAAACSDLLKQKLEKLLGNDCPDPGEWRAFMIQFNQMVREKERLENQAKVQGQNERNQMTRLDSTLTRRQREIDRLRRQEREARERASDRRAQLGQDNQAQGPLVDENDRRQQAAKVKRIKPAQAYSNPLDLSSKALKARAWSALHHLSGRIAQVNESSDCNCKMIALRAAKQVNNTPANLVGELGVGVIFAPILALPISRGATLGISLLKGFANSIFGGGNFTEDAFQSLLSFAGGEIFERLVKDGFLADKASDLMLGAANQAMGAMADDLEKMNWEGETTIYCRSPRRYDKKVKVTVNGLFNKRTGWTVLIIKTDDPNCPDYMVKYRLDEGGILVTNSIQAKAL